MKSTENLEIKKYGLNLRLVEEKDAEFILSLRLNDKLGRFINSTDSDINKQIKWIKEYKIRENEQSELYFITVDENEVRYGTTRIIYNLNHSSFDSGSWLFSQNAPFYISLLSDLACRDYGYEELGFKSCHFDVRKQNTSVVNYHKMFNPIIIDEDDINIYFELPYERYVIQRDKLVRMLVKKVK